MLSNEIIIIPLHQSLKHPCNYISQTAKILSKKNSVVFFDYLFPYPWKSLLKKNNLIKLFNSFSDISKCKKTVYFQAPSILPFSRFEIIVNYNKKIGFWILSVFLWLFKKRVIVWQFYTLITKKVFKNQFFFYDCIDYMNLKDETSSFFYEEKQLFKISDLVSFNSKELFKSKLKINPILAQKSIVSVCGCDNKLFDIKINKIPREFIKISQKKIVFIGIFNFRINVKLLHYIITHNKGLKFIFIGPIRKDVVKKFNKITKEKNVLYLGKKDKKELPFYLKNSDLGIIPYDTKSEFVKYSNPMKTYEYLASGLPVVSTKILALEDYPKDIVYMTDNKEGFNKAIKRLMNNWNDEKITIAKNIAEKNNWKNKIAYIEKFIKKK